MFTIIGGDGKEYGPASVDQIRAWIVAGRANLDTKAKAVGSDEWRRLGDFAEFAPGMTPPPVPSSAAVPPSFAGVPTAAATMGAGVATHQLADRGVRLGSWFLDLVFGMLASLPGSMLIGVSVLKEIIANHGQLSADMMSQALAGFALLTLGGLTLLVIQIWMLTTRGQTLGKRILGIRIINFADHTNPGFVRAVLLRWFVPSLITIVLNLLPLFGFLFWVVDSCFIFRADRRCIHDLIAGTVVVKA